MTSYALRSASPAKVRVDAVVVGTCPAEKRGRSAGSAPTARLAAGADDVAAAYGRRLAPLLATLGVTGKAGEIVKVPTGDVLTSPLLVLVGLGEPDGSARSTDGDGAGAPRRDGLRRAAGAAARAVTNAASVALALPVDDGDDVRAVLEGYLLGGYTFSRFKGTPPEPKAPAEVVVLTPLARRKELAAVLDEAQVRAAAVAGVRDWVNTPPGDLTPPVFADEVVAAAAALRKEHKGAKVEVEVLDEKRLAELGCGGLLGVGSGSAAPPRLVELRWAPKGATTHVALVGKGITFDSGGLTIKPATGMVEMKSDMAGAASVVQATFAAAALDLPVRITAYAALAENMVGGDSMRPGDVLTIYGGQTVEVLNTDAEGRLVLADALVRAVEEEPDVIVDVATLTGHMVVALGQKIGGVLGDDEVVARVREAGEAAGELHWPMPITEEVTERVHASRIADLKQHDWVRWGGGLMAAAFLKEFTGGRPWAHLDIAGPAFNSGGASGHLTPGGTGFATTTLIDLLRAYATD